MRGNCSELVPTWITNANSNSMEMIGGGFDFPAIHALFR